MYCIVSIVSQGMRWLVMLFFGLYVDSYDGIIILTFLQALKQLAVSKGWGDMSSGLRNEPFFAVGPALNLV